MPTSVTVVPIQRVVTVEGSDQVVTVELPGEPGPRGPAGGERQEFEVAAPSDTWGPFAHNLDQYPPVVAITTSGDAFLAEVDYPDRNTVIVRLDSPTAGKLSVG